MRIVNLTSHALVVQSAHGSITLARDPRGPARVIESRDDAPLFASIVTPEGYVDVEALGRPARIKGLPPPEDDVVFVVSRLVLESPLTANRDDLLCPDMGPQGVIRDGAGQIIGTRRLLRRALAPCASLMPEQCEAVVSLLNATWFAGLTATPTMSPRTVALHECLGLPLPPDWPRRLGEKAMPLAGIQRQPTAAEQRAWQEGLGVAQVADLQLDWRERLAIALGSRVPPSTWTDVAFAFSELTPENGTVEEATRLACRARDAAARRIERLLVEAEARGGTT